MTNCEALNSNSITYMYSMSWQSRVEKEECSEMNSFLAASPKPEPTQNIHFWNIECVKISSAWQPQTVSAATSLLRLWIVSLLFPFFYNHKMLKWSFIPVSLLGFGPTEALRVRLLLSSRLNVLRKNTFSFRFFVLDMEIFGLNTCTCRELDSRKSGGASQFCGDLKKTKLSRSSSTSTALQQYAYRRRRLSARSSNWHFLCNFHFRLALPATSTISISLKSSNASNQLELATLQRITSENFRSIHLVVQVSIMARSACNMLSSLVVCFLHQQQQQQWR